MVNGFFLGTGGPRSPTDLHRIAFRILPCTSKVLGLNYQHFLI